MQILAHGFLSWRVGPPNMLISHFPPKIYFLNYIVYHQISIESFWIWVSLGFILWKCIVICNNSNYLVFWGVGAHKLGWRSNYMVFFGGGALMRLNEHTETRSEPSYTNLGWGGISTGSVWLLLNLCGSHTAFNLIYVVPEVPIPPLQPMSV